MKKHRIVVLTLAVALIVLIRLLIDHSDKKELNESPRTIVGYFNNTLRFGKGGTISYFYFENEGKKIEFFEQGSYPFLSKNDSVLIRYSTKNSSNAAVVDFYYMQKYKHLKEQQ